MKAATKSLISLTEAAASRIRTIYAKQPDPSQMLKLGLERRGCLGTGYKMSFIKLSEKDPLDEVVEDKGVKFVVDSKSFMYLVGTTVDYSESDIEAKFVYNNPNVKVCLIHSITKIGDVPLWDKLQNIISLIQPCHP